MAEGITMAPLQFHAHEQLQIVFDHYIVTSFLHYTDDILLL